MRIVLLSPLAIFPAHGGSYARLQTLSAWLMSQGHDVDFVYMPPRKSRPWDREAHRAFFGGGFHVLRRPAAGELAYLARRLMSLAKRLAFRRGVRMDGVDDIYFAPFSRQIAALHARRRYDVAIAVYVYSSRALEALARPCLRVLDTLDSSAHEIPPGEERRALARADVVLAIQDEEAAAFRRLLGSDAGKVCMVSHMPPPRTALSVERTIGATFVGSAFEANRSALGYFVDHVLPLVLAEAPAFRLVVAGPIAGEAPDHPAIVKLGACDDIAEAYARAPVALNPVLSGTGIKIKLLDALALGVPVVSTAFGLTGVPREALGGVAAIPDRDAPAFAAAVLRLYRDAAYRAQMGAQAAASAADWTAAQHATLNAVLSRAEAAR